jgi:hypothetical protein
VLSQRNFYSVNRTRGFVQDFDFALRAVNKFFPKKLQLGAVKRGLRAARCREEAGERIKAEG